MEIHSVTCAPNDNLNLIRSHMFPQLYNATVMCLELKSRSTCLLIMCVTKCRFQLAFLFICITLFLAIRVILPSCNESFQYKLYEKRFLSWTNECLDAAPVIIINNYRLEDIHDLRKASIYSAESPEIHQCGLTFVTNLVDDQHPNINGIVQIKSVYTNLESFKSEWHMRTLFIYSLDKLLGLGLTPTSHLVLLNRHNIVRDKQLEKRILSNTKCIPKTHEHFITSVATVWEQNITTTSATHAGKFPEYTLLLYLGNCRKSDHSHFKSSITNNYRNIDTDRCFMPRSVTVKTPEHDLFSEKVLCKLPKSVISNLLKHQSRTIGNTFLDNSGELGPTFASCMLTIYKDYAKYNVAKDQIKHFIDIDKRVSKVLSSWKIVCEIKHSMNSTQY